MSDNIAWLRDADGREHHTSRTSKFAVEGLARGELVDIEAELEQQRADAELAPSDPASEEGRDGTADEAAGDDPQPRRRDRRPRNPQQAAGTPAATAPDEGVAQPEVDG